MNTQKVVEMNLPRMLETQLKDFNMNYMYIYMYVYGFTLIEITFKIEIRN